MIVRWEKEMFMGIEEVGIVDDTSRKGAVSEINEHIGASPVENDIISELEGLIENWRWM